jgi:hypothetical protein
LNSYEEEQKVDVGPLVPTIIDIRLARQATSCISKIARYEIAD